MTSATIIPYPARAAHSDKLLVRDKIEVCRWEASGRAPEFSRVVIHDHVDLGSDEVDLILVYGPDSSWARWGLARRAGLIVLWQCSNGQELGLFHTMGAALNALDQLRSKAEPDAAYVEAAVEAERGATVHRVC